MAFLIWSGESFLPSLGATVTLPALTEISTESTSGIFLIDRSMEPAQDAHVIPSTMRVVFTDSPNAINGKTTNKIEMTFRMSTPISYEVFAQEPQVFGFFNVKFQMLTAIRPAILP